MLVDSGAGLNLISPAVISKLHIAEEELEVTGTFQGANPDRSHSKGKITLPVTFRGELNYRTEKVVFDVVDLPLLYNGILGRPAGQVHGRIPLCLQHFEDARAGRSH